MAAVALINSTHKMNGQTRPLREQNTPPSATQGKSFQKIRNLQESLRAGLAKRSSSDLTAEGDQTLKANKTRTRRESQGEGARRLLGLGLRRTESKATLGQNGNAPKDKPRGWTPFRAPTLRIATLSSPDLKKLADDADVTPSIHELISAPKTRRPTVQNVHNSPPPSTPSRTRRAPSPVSPSPAPRRRPANPSSPTPGASPETRSRSPTAPTQRVPSTSVSRTTSPTRPSHRPPPLASTSTTTDGLPTNARQRPNSPLPSSPPPVSRRPSSPPVTSRAITKGHQPSESISSLAPAPFRDDIRAAASFLVKELSRQPPHIKSKDWEEVELRMRPLVRAERVWGPSGAPVSGSQLGSPGSGSRERRVFGDALRDGVVLCQLMNKLRPGVVRKVGNKEDGSRNIRNFRYAMAMYGVDPDEMFDDDDLLECSPEGLGSVARTLLHLANLIEDERQSFVVIHDNGKAKSTLFVSASRIIGKTEPVKFDEKAEGFGMTQSGNANGGRSPYGTLSRQMGVMSNPELASAARPTSPVETRSRDKAPPVALGHRSSQRAPSQSPAPSAPSSPKPIATRAPSFSPKAKMTRVVTPESKGVRTSSPLLERPRLEPRRSSVDPRSSMGGSGTSSPVSPPPLSPRRQATTSVSNQRQSTTSMVTNSSQMTDSTAAFSSLLDSRYSNGFGTMRTNTTEATSPSSGIPSFSRSEANEAAKAVLLTESPKATRARLSENGNSQADRSHSPDEAQAPAVSGQMGVRASTRRDRRSSEAAADLTRVNEEPDESSSTSGIAPSRLLVRRRDRVLDNIDTSGKRVARKWPDDYNSALDADTNPIDELEKELLGDDYTNKMDVDIMPPPPRPIAIPRRSSPPPLLSADEMQTRSRPILVPRRSKRYSGESGILPSPREGIVLGASARDGSPSSGAESPGPQPILRRPSSQNARRIVPKGSTPPGSEIMDRRGSPSALGPSPLSGTQGLPSESPRVPFPRAVSTEWAPGPRLPTLPSSSETLREDAAEKEQKDGEGQKREKEKKRVSEPPQPRSAAQPQPQPQPQRPSIRGRHQSEYDSQRRTKPRPGSMDEVGVRRSRIESMFEGMRSEERLAHSPPPQPRGQIPRRVLVVKEEGQPPVHYSLGDCIGKGQFGSVYRALNLNTGQVVAVKQLALDGLKPEEVKNLKKEVDLLKSLSHPGIVKYEGMAQDEDHLSIVLEYVENGSLGQTLKAFGKLNEKLVASYVIRILEGLHYLHQSSVVHCDLKAANILTTKNGNVKLSDFGVSLNLTAMEKVNEVAGTPNWMAPEVIELKGASTKSDIWSLGCVIVELLTGRPPYGDIPNGLTVMFRIVEDESPPIPEGFSPMLRNFLELCFNKDPDLRPSAAILFEHPWLKQKWGAHKELRPQDSIPFLRRVSADLQRSDAVRQLAISMDPSIYNGSALDDVPRSPPTRPSITIPHSNEEPLFIHQFTGNSFSKPVHCNVCDEPVRKHALICDFCRLIVHTRCEQLGFDMPCERRIRNARYESGPQSPTTGAMSSSPPSHPDSVLHSSTSVYNKFVGNWKKRASQTASPEPVNTNLPTVLVSGRPPSLAHSRDSDDRRRNRSSTGSRTRTGSLRSAVTASSAMEDIPEPAPVVAPVALTHRLEPKPRYHRRQVSDAPSSRHTPDLPGPARSESTAERRSRKRDPQHSKSDNCVVQ
ncbi:cytokinesis protein sepH [Ceratobasidium sp. AG-Ba]|nr:cytokinesis protein sepH [Ceratobasidium sp. AG-Ba]